MNSLHSDRFNPVFGSILLISDRFYPVLDRFYRFWIDSMYSDRFYRVSEHLSEFTLILYSFGLILLGFGSTLSSFGSILSVSDRFYPVSV